MDHGWDYTHWARKSKRERARLLAFYQIRGQVNSYSANGEQLKKSGITLEEWLGLSEQAREMKLKFARANKG